MEEVVGVMVAAVAAEVEEAAEVVNDKSKLTNPKRLIHGPFFGDCGECPLSTFHGPLSI